ncbi:hypothetical protein EAI89_11270, partial [Eubacterium sp. am_0171]
EIIGFLVMCQWCSIFRAVSRLEFLRPALSVFERTWMFSGRLSAIPLWSAPIRAETKAHHYIPI